MQELLAAAPAQATALTELQQHHSDLQEHSRETVGLLREALHDLTKRNEQLTAGPPGRGGVRELAAHIGAARAAALLRRHRS